MAYVLRQTKRKRGVYLQIYLNKHERGKGTVSSYVETLGYVDDILKEGKKDPISYAKKKVEKLNEEYREEKRKRKAKKINRETGKKRLGHFVLSAVKNALKSFEDDTRRLLEKKHFQYDSFGALMDLVYARIVEPCSKRKTFLDVLPTLVSSTKVSYDQILSLIEWVGQNHRKIAAALTRSVNETYGLDFSTLFFDATNFYFEIDEEDSYRRKGPSKENRRDPIIGMGLLLDSSLIPLGASFYPGNQTERTEIRKVVRSLKSDLNLNGHLIEVADKGLISSENIFWIRSNGDGYIMSMSIKNLPEKEIDYLLSIAEENFEKVYERGSDGKKKERYRYFSFIDEFDYPSWKGSSKGFRSRELRVLTFSPKLWSKQMLEINRLVEKAKKMCASQAKREEYGESSRFVSFTDGKGGKAKAEINNEAIERARRFCGYNLFVTSETQLSPRRVIEVYRMLWKTEESFRILKNSFDSRPVYVYNTDRIIGHFMICYIALVFERILELKVFLSRFTYVEIIDFIRGFEIAKRSSCEYQNLLDDRDEVGKFLGETVLPEATNAYLSERDIKRLMDYKFEGMIVEN